MGGSSAFGTRAGDVFTRITIVTASAWIALNMGLVVNANSTARHAQVVPGGEFLPEGVGGTGVPQVPGGDTDTDTTADADESGTTAGGADSGTPKASDELPPVFDADQPADADHPADADQSPTPKGSD